MHPLCQFSTPQSVQKIEVSNEWLPPMQSHSVILAAAFRRLQANKSEFLPLNRSVPLLVLIGLESIHRVVQ